MLPQVMDTMGRSFMNPQLRASKRRSLDTAIFFLHMSNRGHAATSNTHHGKQVKITCKSMNSLHTCVYSPAKSYDTAK